MVMSVITTTAAPPAAASRPGFGRLTVTELKLFIRERVGPIWGVGFPLLLLIIFGGIHAFNKPQRVFGEQLAGFVIATLLAAAALLAVGLFVAATAGSGRGAQAIGTILFFPMMFFAGLWVPIAQMPKLLARACSC
jgi:hypothetical protein